MKNKVISAMLLGMSATMAVPGTVVMAAEDGSESTAVEETAAEVPETEGGASEAEQNDEESQDKQDTDTAVQKMIDYATDESAKVADTPADFGPKLSNIVFSDDVFGRYADSLNEYINGSEIDTDSIYNCEMDMVDKVAELTKDESTEAIAASKYQVALTFESVYGEDAFMPGRDIRRALIADSSSVLAFDGSGSVTRDDNNHALATFTTGKQYNCDLSASYNIGARYFIRGLLKSLPATEESRVKAKVPDAGRRTSCTLSTLRALAKELSAA